MSEDGIKYLVKDEYASSMGEISPLVASQHIWIMDAEQMEAARSILEMLKSSAATVAGEMWTCAQCNEKLEPQFTECWSCGAKKPG